MAGRDQARTIPFGCDHSATARLVLPAALRRCSHSSFPMKVSVGNVTPPLLQSYNSKPQAVPILCYGNARLDSRSAAGAVWLGRLVVLLAAGC